MLFVSQFHSYSKNTQNIVKKYWLLLRNNFPEVEEFRYPLLPSYRRGQTIYNHVVYTDLKPIVREMETFLGTPFSFSVLYTMFSYH